MDEQMHKIMKYNTRLKNEYKNNNKYNGRLVHLQENGKSCTKEK